RLRELRAVAIERIGFEPELPGENVSRLAVLNRRLVRHIDGLGNGAGDERLRRRQHADVTVDRQEALAGAPARIGEVEHGIMFGLEMRRTFDRHGAADIDVRRLDLALGEAEMSEEVEIWRGQVSRRDAEFAKEISAKRPFVEDELDVESGRQ